MGVSVYVLGKPIYDRSVEDTRPYNERVKPTSETYAVVISKSSDTPQEHDLTRIEVAEFGDIDQARRCASEIRVAIAKESIR